MAANAGSSIGSAIGDSIGGGVGGALGGAIGGLFGPSYQAGNGGEVERQLNGETDSVYADPDWRRQYYYMLQTQRPDLWESGDIWDEPLSSHAHAGVNRGRWLNAISPTGDNLSRNSFWISKDGVLMDATEGQGSGAGGGKTGTGQGEGGKNRPPGSSTWWTRIKAKLSLWWTGMKPAEKWLVRAAGAGLVVLVLWLIFRKKKKKLRRKTY